MIDKLPASIKKSNQAPGTSGGLVCPQCGAPLPSDTTCSDLFYAAQLKEIDNPDYYSVHHLSVPCYMLQHDAYSKQGWVEVYRLLQQFIDGLTPQEARRRINQALIGTRKTFSLTKGERMPGLADVSWSWTIARVRLETADQYVEDVRQWARHTLSDARKVVEQYYLKPD